MININELINKYKKFHDSVIESSYYDINTQKAEIVLDALDFSEKNFNKRDKVKIIFSNVKEICIKEMFSWDFIREVVIERSDDGKLMFFRTDIEKPVFSVICEEIDGEII